MADQLIILSTRLPISVSKVNGRLHFTSSDGGLATGLSAVTKKIKSVWIGWPGVPSEELTEKDKIAIRKELKKYNCHPVYLSKEQVDSYYSGYCNATLWPLFHYFNNFAKFEPQYWDSYRQVNEQFAEEVRAFISEHDRIWVHDYQLMLLPSLLREMAPTAKIGFFLHTPFPSYELFRLLPEREEVLRGLLGADLVGFHTYDYVRHFLQSVNRTLGIESTLGTLRFEDKVVHTDAFPIGIDYEKFAKPPKRVQAKQMAKALNVFKKDHKIILAFDRADYSKGIPARLDAFEIFLREYKEYHDRVVLILIAAPSRGGVAAYQELRTTIEQKVSRINGEFSTVEWSPIIYLYQSIPFDDVTSLYLMSDVMLVTPLRDGMNLMAKEFVATKQSGKGVLILSELAGVASELPEAVQVNPNDTEMVAQAIKQALEMPVSEQRKRMRAMQTRISEYTITRWAKDFITQLDRVAERQKKASKGMGKADANDMIARYKEAQERLILLDYDGTLRELVSSHAPLLARPSKRVLTVLRQLSADPRNKVVIVSGRPRAALSMYFKGLGLGVVAEHGGWILDAGGWVKSSLASKKWKSLIYPILKEYASRTPGAQVEEKDFALVWHYRRVTPDLAYVRKEELKMELRHVLAGWDVGVYDGNKIVEIKPRRMHKGVVATEMLDEQSWDFIMAMGDDYTDEDMFKALPERSYTVCVGDKQHTDARFQVPSVSRAVALLEQLAECED